jgi:DNA-binding transcriptional MerR regulator
MQRFGFTLQEIRRVLQLYAVPDEEGASPRFSRGSDRCLDEVAEIGERKLKSLDEDRKCGRLNNPFLAFPA